MLDNYYTDPFGVVHQRNVDNFKKDYAAQYNGYGELSNYMSYLRYGYMIGACKPEYSSIKKVLDIGYGNGSFLKVCQQAGLQATGYDIDKYPVPEGCFKVKDIPSIDDSKHTVFDVVTMFDSFEHFEDLNFVYNLPTDFLVISVPNAHSAHRDDWFEKWKHRRPNEHLHYFDLHSLRDMLTYKNFYKFITHSYIEDVIRKGEESKNILTMVFKR